MIDKEDVARREKRGEWRGRDDGGLDGGGLPPRAGAPSRREAEGGVSGGDEGRPTGEMSGTRGVGKGGLGGEEATPEGGDSLGVKYDGGSLRWRWRTACGRDGGGSWCRRGGLVAEKAREAERGLNGEESLDDGQRRGEAYRGG